ncbi:MAG TPA: VWA domain-containing protein [Clostridiaceae bacterium]|nr:VWA domain-containing protein [Clostridiaceae bacterium]
MKDLEFKYPLNVIYIIIPIACLIILILSIRKKEKIMNALKIDIKVRFKLASLILAVLGVTLMFFSLLGPQIFKGFVEINREGLDIYFLIDTSKSMLVKDIEPDRISRAKKIIERIIDNLNGDRVGFIPFSSDAYIQMPLTDDYQVAQMFLDVIDTDMIGGGGTNIGAGLNLAANSFDRTSSADRVIIILSDGEEHESNSIEVLRKINDRNLKVFSIGIGTLNGGLIPVYDSEGKQIIEYKKDDNGNFITSKLQRDTLERLAAEGNGAYYQSTVAGDEINALLKDISSLKKNTLKTQRISKYNELYQYFLGLGILLFLASYLLPERVQRGKGNE